MNTKTEARGYVINAIEANGTDVAAAEEFDIDAILDELHAVAEGWDVEQVEHDEFWGVVEKHAQQPQDRIIATLNAYEGDNLWEDVVLSSAVPAYDEAATVALDPQGRSDVFVAAGVTYRYDDRAQAWNAE